MNSKSFEPNCAQFHRLLCIVAIFVGMSSRPAEAQAAGGTTEVLSNAAVVGMVAGKLPKDITLAKIRTTANDFDVTASGLVRLHQSKLPQDVIKAMMAAAADPKLRHQTDQKPEVLSNQDVVQMVVGQLPRSILMDKIRTTSTGFDLTSTGLVSLNQNKVPEDVIKGMMAAANGPLPGAEVKVVPPSGAAAVALPQTNAPAPQPAVQPRPEREAPPLASVPKEPGIYAYADNGKGLTYTLLEPVRYTAGRTSGALASAMTGGLASVKVKAVLSGAEASVRTRDANAEFFFVFEQKSAGVNVNAGPWTTATSASEFTLVRFDVNGNSREVSYASANAFGSQSGTEERAMVSFRSTRLTPGVYRVVPNAALTAGQYAFFISSQAASANRMFDFAIVK